MLTPQEITDKVFIKAIFGGYDMTGVDEFLEAVCSDYTALFKENAILKGKLKVLVEKVEEYRSTEDSMRMALLTAQRLGEEITTEANKQKEETLRSADMEVKTRLADSAKKIADEELRLSVAAKETAKFIELSKAIIRKHSEFLTKLETARRAVGSAPLPSMASSQAGAAQQPLQQQPLQQAQQQQPLQQAQQQQPQQQQQQQQQQPQQTNGQAVHQAGQPLIPQQQPQPPHLQVAPPMTREAQIADTAEQIGNALDRITGGSNGQAPVRAANAETGQHAAQIPNDDAGHTKVYTISSDDNAVTPRPKFDFEDLKFGSNFSNDD